MRSWNWGCICGSGLAARWGEALDHDMLPLILELTEERMQSFSLVLADKMGW